MDFLDLAKEEEELIILRRISYFISSLFAHENHPYLTELLCHMHVLTGEAMELLTNFHHTLDLDLKDEFGIQYSTIMADLLEMYEELRTEHNISFVTH